MQYANVYSAGITALRLRKTKLTNYKLNLNANPLRMRITIL